ncbi:hypothetical protein ABZ861_27945, partial [Streptomyces sp. NPDC046985]
QPEHGPRGRQHLDEHLRPVRGGAARPRAPPAALSHSPGGPRKQPARSPVQPGRNALRAASAQAGTADEVEQAATPCREDAIQHTDDAGDAGGAAGMSAERAGRRDARADRTALSSRQAPLAPLVSDHPCVSPDDLSGGCRPRLDSGELGVLGSRASGLTATTARRVAAASSDEDKIPVAAEADGEALRMRPSAVCSPPMRPSAVCSLRMRPSAVCSLPMRPPAVCSPPMRPSAVCSPPMRPSAVCSPPMRPPAVCSLRPCALRVLAARPRSGATPAAPPVQRRRLVALASGPAERTSPGVTRA